MSAPLQSALDRLAAAVVELRAAAETVLAEVSAAGGSPVRSGDPAVLIPRIIQATAAVYAVTPEQILSDTRTQPVSTARQMAMAISRERCSVSLDQIAHAFHRLNHETVQFACRQISNRRATERGTAAAYAAIMARLATAT